MFVSLGVLEMYKIAMKHDLPIDAKEALDRRRDKATRDMSSARQSLTDIGSYTHKGAVTEKPPRSNTGATVVYRDFDSIADVGRDGIALSAMRDRSPFMNNRYEAVGQPESKRQRVRE